VIKARELNYLLKHGLPKNRDQTLGKLFLAEHGNFILEQIRELEVSIAMRIRLLAPPAPLIDLSNLTCRLQLLFCVPCARIF
jgi:hypothetical protein